jgi:DTW domain-containing protein
MDIETYRQKRALLEQEKTKYRDLCLECRQPGFSCFCADIARFNPHIKFVILIHPLEVKRRIATGRMAFLSLENSELIMGQDYSQNLRVNEIINDPDFQSVVLYPGRNSLNLSTRPPAENSKIFREEKTPVVFVIDGTWNTARKTMFHSQNLNALPRICFTPPAPSRFRVRKQPTSECYSTIEAIHHTIELLGGTPERAHDNLIFAFDKMVERQLAFAKDSYGDPKRRRHFR